jgi:hypothetical protein
VRDVDEFTSSLIGVHEKCGREAKGVGGVRQCWGGGAGKTVGANRSSLRRFLVEAEGPAPSGPRRTRRSSLHRWLCCRGGRGGRLTGMRSRWGGNCGKGFLP